MSTTWGARKRTRSAGVVGLSALLAFGSIPAIATAPALANETEPTTTSVTTPIAVKPVTPEVAVDDGGTPIGAITDVVHEGSVVTLTAANGAMRVTFLDNRNFRLEADPSGEFTDPANTPQNDPARTANIVVGAETFDGAAVSVADGDVITLKTADITLSIEKATGKTTLKRADGSVVWAEAVPITFGGNSATQHLADNEGEQFIGGGMQNGRSVHTDATINIARNFDWDDDGYPNAVPYYMSSNGYGVLRNTFARGSYDFKNNTTTHEEKRFDAYYFVGDYKESLESYTQLTGRPMLPPIYGLEYGDADCYNRGNSTYTAYKDPAKLRTPQALDFAKEFVEHDMPAGWMLVNDGYGCEYVELPETVDAIKEETGLVTGLWTQRSLTNQEFEVGEAGVRMRKLDVAWVGQGYRQALTGCESAYNGIEQYSDARGYSLMVEGWAGSQRCGMQWTGDHSGNLDAVRWQISALTGAGNSGLAFTTGDVDGIFGGSTESYVRDLQWKAFAPALYSMSGWASTDKRPYLYGEEATEINRNYLQLRQRLMPYIYTLAQESHATGMPMMRSMALEYPQDPNSYSAEANNQFLLGEDYLVAPVFKDSDIRNGIYLPAGEQWVDYWTGKIYEGGQVLNGVAAPLEQLPIFVRSGALVPQGITARNASLVPEDSPITLEVYPEGESSFTLYEDEKITREYKDGEFSNQQFDVKAPNAGKRGTVRITIGEREGTYDGMAEARPYMVKAHSGSEPRGVQVGRDKLAKVASQAELDAVESGWFYDAETAGGVVVVKTAPIASGASETINLLNTSAVGGQDADSFAAQVNVGLEEQVFQGNNTTVTATFVNAGTKPKFDVVLTPELPEGWEVLESSGTEARKVDPGKSVTAEFVVTPSSDAAAGLQTLRVSADYKDVSKTERSVSGANQLDVAYGSLQGAFNAVSITDLNTAANGNFDGGGATFSADALAAAGATPGATITVGEGDSAINYTWPTPVGEPNSVEPAGQTIALQGQGTHLAILGTAASGSGVNPELTLTYTDGTVQKANVFFPNWLPQGSLGGAQVAIRSMGRNNSNNPDVYEYPTYGYQVYSNLVRLNPGKELASVDLPTESRVKLFDWQIVEQPLPPAPESTAFISDLNWISATNGYGVIGKDVVNKDSASSPDKPLKINYTDPATGTQPTYEKGLGVHALSKITYYVGGKCSSFTSEVGLEAGFNGNVIFKVDTDGANQYQSRTFTPGFAPESVNVDLTGVQYVDLIVQAPGSINGAHGVWGDAKFNCG
ncbi:alpha-glucosidase (family GH31 glycosyl hydrolase) [Arthrobacter pigmenti]|uniref:Alpha-glucosidase (Family GH31 glycosyl hydrolase) n=1 Tax=Arthrobacter pigmenti TaxID=271432 RepID=A0A846RD11_9MICC|nr:NPCBM/NEW2 domain-containing protein [Arthrobacter pigmenti]NJC20988.1 alpha-glucosidase (family GH31 glycosyl hydrolase) [Arthrobacter pigmenti]